MKHPQTRFPYSITKLDDGLRIVFVPMPSAASVSMDIYVGAGSRYEDDDIAGISHFLEHMAFKGTKKRKTAREVSLAIEGIGGVLNAWTSEEATNYWCQLPAVHFAKGFAVLADMLLNSTFPAVEIEREAKVILEEMAREEDSPDQRVYDVFTSLLFPNQALGRRVIGTEKTVLAVTRDKLLNYVASLYAPQNSVVVIAGPLQEKAVIKTVEKFLTMPRRKLTRSWQPMKPKTTKDQVSVYKKDTEQVHLILGLRTFAREDERTPIQSVLNTILGQGMSSRLFINVRERKGLAYSIGSANDYFRDTGTWFTYGGIARGKIDAAVAGILEELNGLREKPVGTKELGEAKEKIRGRFTIGLETTSALANYYGKQVLLEKDVETPEQWMAHIDQVTAKQIQDHAQSIFKAKDLQLALIAKEGDEAHFEQLLHF